MKKLASAALLVAGAIAGAQTASAQASFTANDLYLGFNVNSATSTASEVAGDYIVDLGQPGAVGLGGSSVVNLSGDLSSSLFDQTFTSGSTGVSMGVVGGDPTYGQWDIYATQARSGGAGNAAVAGSNLGGLTFNHSAISTSVIPLTGNPWPAAGNGLLDPTKSWTTYVEPTLTSGSFFGNSSVNPSSAIDGSGILYEDLWSASATASSGGAFKYLGYFTLDFSGSNPSLTFTPSPVPEPSAGSLAGAAALLLLLFRRKCNPRTA